jgi:3-phosphoshikimate 1-carboxyvinyltransferase
MVLDPPAAVVEEPLRFSAHKDHRMAMSLALFERVNAEVTLDDPDCVSKSFPLFWKTWRAVHPDSRIAEDL